MSLLGGFLRGAGGADAFFSAQDARQLARDKFNYQKEQDVIRNEDAVVRNQLAAERNRNAADRLKFDKDMYEDGEEQRAATLESTLIGNSSSALKLSEDQIAFDFKRGGQIQAELQPFASEDDPFSYDMDTVLETRPDLAARIIQLDSSLTMYRDGRGNPVQLTQPRVEKLPNSDMYTVTVRRPDGARVPFTQNASDQPNDPVATFTKDEIKSLMTNAVNARTPNAMQAMRYGDLNRVVQNRLRMAISSQVQATPIGQDPAASRSIQRIAYSDDISTEDLETIATDLGIDVAALKTDLQEEAPEPAPQGKYMFRGGDKNSRGGKIIQEIEGTRKQKTNNPRMQPRGPEGAMAALMKYKSELETRIANTEGVPVKRGTDKVSTLEQLQAKRDKRVAADKAELRQIDDYLLFKNPPEPTGAIDKVTLRNRLMAEIDANPPTQDQVQEVQRVLQENEITDPRQLSRLPDEQAYQAIMIAAAREPDATKRGAIIDQLTNLMMTGVSNQSLEERNASDLRAAEHVQTVRKFMADRGDKALARFDSYVDEISDAASRLSTVVGGLSDPSGKYMTPTPEARTELYAIASEYAQLPKSDRKTALAPVVMAGVFEYIAASASQKNPGLFEFMRKVDRWKANPGGLRIGVNGAAGLIRVADGGKTIVFKSPTGGDATYRIPANEFRELLTPDLFREVIKIARANTDAAGN
ncbi:MAG: hypothetical protein CL581_15735 [Alteromonadaceae bacterium]|nr:hypothetical protein [Alteromonadaceae bacterium]